MSPEFILLIISLIGNFVVILKRINLIYTPCLSIDCRSNNDNEGKPDEEIVDENKTTMVKRIINKITPRKKELRNEVIPVPPV